MLTKDGRIAWPVFLAAVFSTLAILATDYAWRVVPLPAAVIAAGGLLLLLAGNAAILLFSRKRTG